MAGAAGLGRPCSVAGRPRLFCLRLAIDLCAVLLLAAGPMLRGIHHVCAAPAGTVFRIGRIYLPIELHDTIPSSCVTDGRVFPFAWKALGSFLVEMGAVTAASEKNAPDVGAKEMTGRSSGRARPRAIDFHAHVIVPEVYAVAAQHNVFSELPTDPGVTDEMRRNIKERAATVLARMSDVTERIGNMDAMGVDVQVLSASLVHQGLEWADAQTSLRLARTTNDWIAKAVAAHPARLVGLGTLPLHVPALAVAELERCVRELRLKVAAISTTAGAMELGDPQLRPFWAKAEELGAVIYIHPGGNRDRRFKRFHLWNSVGQAFEEAMAISSLMYDGVLATFPRLRISVSHGGGYMPFYMGRIDRNYLEKANTRVNMKKPPIDYLRMLYFDSCVYERPVLQHLVDKVGADRVLLGSVYPVGETKPIEFVTNIETLSTAQKERILSTNAAALLGLAN